MLAGDHPEGEIRAIREVMPKARIVAADRERECVALAQEAGADVSLLCDLDDYQVEQTTRTEKRFSHSDAKWTEITVLLKPRIRPHAAVEAHGPYDILDLDLCSGPNESTQRLAMTYWPLVAPNGVFILTFSYGRDVSEVFEALSREWICEPHEGAADPSWCRYRFAKAAFEKDVPQLVAGRIMYLFQTHPARLNKLATIAVYRGTGGYPMCSLLFSTARTRFDDGFEFWRVEPGDLELALVYPEAASLYDTPKERIEALRRQFAAIKASLTRGLKAEQLEMQHEG